MVFQLQKLSNYGASTPAVARTLLQGSDILRFFAVAEAKKEEAKEVLQQLQRHLVRCVEERDSVAQEVAAAHEQLKAHGLDVQSEGRVVTLPSVADVQSRAESFLQCAKLAIRETAQLVKPFYQVDHDHRFHKFAVWAQDQFGPADEFTQMVREWEPWVRYVVTMRNAVDHPTDQAGGKLIVNNFTLRGTALRADIIDPTWGLTGEPQRTVVNEMTEAIESIIVLGEEVLTGLFYKLKSPFPLAIHVIPIEQRNQSCPIRLRVGLAAKIKHATQE